MHDQSCNQCMIARLSVEAQPGVQCSHSVGWKLSLCKRQNLGRVTWGEALGRDRQPGTLVSVRWGVG